LPHSYSFRLYDTTGGAHTYLNSVVVTSADVNPSGIVFASPNPCTISSGAFCSAALNWTTGNVTSTQLTVQDSVGGGEVVFFNGGPSGSNATAPWIQASPHSYTFKLYDTTGGGHSFLSSVVVTGSAGSATGSVTAAPTTCSITSGAFCSTNISYNTTGLSSAQVTVQDSAGGGEVVFFNGGPSAQNVTAPWIQAAPHNYAFRLYDTTGGGHTLLSAVAVSGTTTGSISATPNPCQITSGRSAAATSAMRPVG